MIWFAELTKYLFYFCLSRQQTLKINIISNCLEYITTSMYENKYVITAWSFEYVLWRIVLNSKLINEIYIW